MKPQIKLQVLCGIALMTAMTATAQAAPMAATYPTLQTIFGQSGKVEFIGWKKVRENEWAADPSDPTSPRVFAFYSRQPMQSPKPAFDAALKQFGIKQVANRSTTEMKTCSLLTRTECQAWVTAATAKVNGTDYSLIAPTIFTPSERNHYTFTFMMPTRYYQQLGGVKYMMDIYNMTPHVTGLPDNFNELARQASPAEQTKIFAGLLDITVMNLTMSTLNAQAGVLDTLQGIGKDLQTRTDCMQTPNCRFIPGGLPGQARTSYGP